MRLSHRLVYSFHLCFRHASFSISDVLHPGIGYLFSARCIRRSSDLRAHNCNALWAPMFVRGVGREGVILPTWTEFRFQGSGVDALLTTIDVVGELLFLELVDDFVGARVAE